MHFHTISCKTLPGGTKPCPRRTLLIQLHSHDDTCPCTLQKTLRSIFPSDPGGTIFVLRIRNLQNQRSVSLEWIGGVYMTSWVVRTRRRTPSWAGPPRAHMHVACLCLCPRHLITFFSSRLHAPANSARFLLPCRCSHLRRRPNLLPPPPAAGGVSIASPPALLQLSHPLVLHRPRPPSNPSVLLQLQ
jgi:hypothetical protein